MAAAAPLGIWCDRRPAAACGRRRQQAMFAHMHSRRAFMGGLLAAAEASLPAAAGDLEWLTLEQASSLLRQGRVTPVELTQACLRRIETLNPGLNAFITVTAQQAMDQARALHSELRKGRWRSPLHGIPVALKDLIDTAGVRTTAASGQYRDRVPTEDADVVHRLKTAGAVLVGKLNMDEFAYHFTSETSFFGPGHNPWDRRRSPGGSSGGSAVAVATGMCYASLGSDTGGSIRLPAALCGITGLKPSYGRVSTKGAAPLAWSLDHIGPMCRNARDAALVLNVIAGQETAATAARLPPLPAAETIFARNLRSLRLGVPRATYYDRLDAEVAQAVTAALKVLEPLTAGVQEVRLPALTPAPEALEFPLSYLRVIKAEAYAFHEDTLKRQPGRYHEVTRRSIEGGAGISAADYIRARREMETLRAQAGRLFAQAELLITPAAPAPAFELGKPAELIFLRNAAPWNLYGLPSISIPCGFTAAGLPVGLQITGPPAREDLVLALAGAYQQATAWHTKRPPL